MNKVFATVLLAVIGYSAQAQTTDYKGQPYGKVDLADLQMTSCDFEKDVFKTINP